MRRAIEMSKREMLETVHEQAGRWENSRMADPFALPPDLPVPQDDGACDHLTGMEVPGLSLESTAGRAVNLAGASIGRTVFFFYPRTGVPGRPVPPEWDRIPGARG